MSEELKAFLRAVLAEAQALPPWENAATKARRYVQIIQDLRARGIEEPDLEGAPQEFRTYFQGPLGRAHLLIDLLSGKYDAHLREDTVEEDDRSGDEEGHEMPEEGAAAKTFLRAVREAVRSYPEFTAFDYLDEDMGRHKTYEVESACYQRILERLDLQEPDLEGVPANIRAYFTSVRDRGHLLWGLRAGTFDLYLGGTAAPIADEVDEVTHEFAQSLQGRRLDFLEFLWALREEAEAYDPPKPDGPSARDWAFRYMWALADRRLLEPPLDEIPTLWQKYFKDDHGKGQFFADLCAGRFDDELKVKFGKNWKAYRPGATRFDREFLV